MSNSRSICQHLWAWIVDSVSAVDVLSCERRGLHHETDAFLIVREDRLWFAAKRRFENHPKALPEEIVDEEVGAGIEHDEQVGDVGEDEDEGGEVAVLPGHGDAQQLRHAVRGVAHEQNHDDDHHDNRDVALAVTAALLVSRVE